MPSGKSGGKSKVGASGASGAAVVAVAASAEAIPEETCVVLDDGLRDLPEVSSGVTLEAMRKVTGEMKELVYSYWDGRKTSQALGILELTDSYEKLLVNLLVENERLRGRLEVLTSRSYTTKVASAAAKAAVKAAVPVAAPAVVPVATAVPAVVPAAVSSTAVTSMPNLVETWSVVVRGKKGVSSKEVMEKVVKQVGPHLGVRVHEMRQLRDGGTVIRTRSVVEREKLMENEKFKELDLEVVVNEKAGPKVLVRGVSATISPDEFMADLFKMNLSECMSLDDFKKKVRMASKPWKTDDVGAEVNVVLEGEESAMRRLLEAGRVYVKWYSFRTRLQDAVPHCFRCLGFGHRVRECKHKEDVCRLCGMSGHMAARCTGVIRCRDCSVRGLSADHRMLSHSCPVYAELVARANARH